MRKISLFVAVLLFMAAPAMADSTVTITCVSDGNSVTITYAVSGSASLIRAFGLDITIEDDDANIVKVDTLDPNYRIYPGQIGFVEGDVNDYGTPYAEDDIGDSNLTVEMGSLYTEDANYAGDPNAGYNMKPTQNGTLLKFYTDPKTCHYTIDVNEARGGIVMEDPYEVVNHNLPCDGNITVGCTVPDVVGMTEANACAAIVAAQLVCGDVTYEFDDTMPVGDVISSDPIAGTTVDCGSDVDIVVSLGPCIVPNIVGMNTPDANAAIEAAGFTVGTMTGDFNDTIPINRVTAQDPNPGTQPCGSAVNYTYICRRVTCGTCKGDFNGDGWVRIGDRTDLAALLSAAPSYRVRNTDCKYNPCCDGIGGSAADNWNRIGDLTDLSNYLTPLTSYRCRCGVNCP